MPERLSLEEVQARHDVWLPVVSWAYKQGVSADDIDHGLEELELHTHAQAPFEAAVEVLRKYWLGLLVDGSPYADFVEMKEK